MPDEFYLDDDELQRYHREFLESIGTPFGIRFEHTPGTPVTPNPYEPLRNYAVGPSGKLVRADQETIALRYLWARINKGRDYVSLARMARDLSISYDDAERLVAQAHANRKIPRLVIVEEVEG